MKSKKIMQYMMKLLKPYKKKITFILVCMILVTCISMIIPLISQRLFDKGIVAKDMNQVVMYIIIIISLVLIEKGITFIQFTQYEYINEMIPFKLLFHTLDHSLHLKFSYYKDHNFYKIIDNTYTDINVIAQVINSHLLEAIVSLFKILGGLIGLTMISWKLTIFVLIIIPFKLIISRKLSKHRKKALKLLMEHGEKFSIWFNETLNAVELVKLWNLYKRKRREFVSLRKKVLQQNFKLAYVENIAQMSDSALNAVFSNLLLLFGAWLIKDSELTIGGLFAFSAYSVYIIQPVGILSYIYYSITGSLPAFERHMAFFENEIEPQKKTQTGFVKTIDTVESIDFQCVSFGFEKEKKILNSMDFSIKRGEKVAFVGLNGSGKSTIVNLLLGFFEPVSGSIRVNGAQIGEIGLNEYRELFSVMNQNVHMFNNSIRNNINIRQEIDDAKINKCMSTADLHEFVAGLKEGLDTFVGYNGTKLSGGERQKVALARTMGKNGRILVLDEATANIDFNSEYLFNDYIGNTHQYDIIIVVTHRIDILKKLDKIFIVENGIIADSGTFTELNEKNKNFKEIFIKERWKKDECSIETI